jgi:hypothetical protein
MKAGDRMEERGRMEEQEPWFRSPSCAGTPEV